MQDPEFYEFLKEHDKELFGFDEYDLDDNLQTDAKDDDDEEEVDDDSAEHSDPETAMEEETSTNVITTTVFSTMSSSVFNKGLEIWTGVVCAYSNEADLRPLAYPLTQIIIGIDANSDFVNKKQTTVALLLNDTVAESFLEDEKKSGSGTRPLSQYVVTLRQRAKERSGTLIESSVLIGDRSSKFGSKISSDDDEYDDSEMEDNASALLSVHYSKQQKNVSNKSTNKHTEEMALDDDIVEDLVLSSDEDVPLSDSFERDQQARSSKKRKHGSDMHKGKKKRMHGR
ncbi:Noc2p family [Salvia divinorum]|uniref:Noc2p family n=1 Tax=Salvia divinorum TaxID=28513 RepID=A0ABD1GA74_SALDI